MSCNCNSQEMVRSWIDWFNQEPQNPLDVIANAVLGSTTGIYLNSTTFSNAPGTPVANPFTINGAPTCFALGTDSAQKVADAEQWNFEHLTWNSSTTVAPPLKKVIFLRGGTEWQMKIPINLGAATYTDLQLSFRDNAGTRGDQAGTIPVISFTGSFSGSQQLSLTLKQYGHMVMGLRAIDSLSNWSMYESEWIVVP